MKERIIVILICVVSTLPVFAQEGLNINQFFTGEFMANPKVTSVEMNGKTLDWIGLKAYKSITVLDDAALADRIVQAVNKDGAKAKSKEVSYKEGQLYFGFYSMGGTRGNQRYILYLNRRPVGKEKTTTIYIQGDLSDKEVKELINK